MSATIEELPTTQLPARPPMVLRPSVREALWGFVFIGPWLIGLVLFIAGPMIASFVMSLTDFNLVHPETTKFIGIDNYIRMTSDPTIGAVAHRDPQVRVARDPRHDGRQPRLRAAAQPPEDAGQGPAPGAGLHADHDPARRLDARLDRLPQHRDGLAQPDPRRVRPAAAGLDQQRDLDLPGADDDRPVGDRQLHDHQHRRAAVGPHRAVRGGPHRRGGHLAVRSAGSRSRCCRRCCSTTS